MVTSHLLVCYSHLYINIVCYLALVAMLLVVYCTLCLGGLTTGSHTAFFLLMALILVVFLTVRVCGYTISGLLLAAIGSISGHDALFVLVAILLSCVGGKIFCNLINNVFVLVVSLP